MPRNSAAITIITGAGSSYDCVNPNHTGVREEYKPPLTKQLFLNRAFHEILGQYPDVEHLSDHICTSVANGSSLEDVLRDLSRSTDRHTKRCVRVIPYYLQHVIATVAVNYKQAGGSKFDTLVMKIRQSNIRCANYITTNYDTFLEDALYRGHGTVFNSLADYACPNGHWCLCKLHGSITWARQVAGWQATGSDPFVEILRNMPEDLELSNEISIFSSGKVVLALDRSRGVYYPALSAPIRGDYKIQAPAEMVDRSRELLMQSHNLIVIGSSFSDQTLCDIVKGATMKNVVIVSDTGEGKSILSNIIRAGVTADSFRSFEKGFMNFMESDAINEYLG